MDSQWLKRLRPRWTISTMLILIAWSSLVVWLNIRRSKPQREWWAIDGKLEEMVLVHCGYPWTYVSLPATDPVLSSRLHPDLIDFEALAGNVIIGLLAIAILTWGSACLLNRIVSAFTFGGIMTD